MAPAFCVGLALTVARAARVGERAPTSRPPTATDKPTSFPSTPASTWCSNGPTGLPYTQKHYSSGNMQNLQREWTAKGVIWLTVASSAPGEQGYVTSDQENAYLKQANAAPTAALLDPSGALGHLYNAKTTPDMYVINPQGILIYEGAIDDRPSSDPSDIRGAKNYVSLALSEAMAGKPVSVATSQSYGCSVKYR